MAEQHKHGRLLKGATNKRLQTPNVKYMFELQPTSSANKIWPRQGDTNNNKAANNIWFLNS